MKKIIFNAIGKCIKYGSVVAVLVLFGAYKQQVDDNTRTRTTEIPDLRESVIRTEEAVKPIPGMAEDIQSIQRNVAVLSAILQRDQKVAAVYQ